MSNATLPALSFVKIIVADVDRVFSFYERVFGVEQHARVQTGSGEDALEEIISRPVGNVTAPTLAIKRYLNRPAPPPGELQLGFIVPNVDVVVATAIVAGGSIAQPARDAPEHGVRVAFLYDVEGHTIEIVQLLEGLN